MKRYRYLLLPLALTACTVPSLTQTQPAPVVIQSPAPVVSVPPVTPALPGNPRFDILDASLVTVTSPDEKTVSIALTQLGTPVWLRVRLPNGTISKVTTSPAGEFIGLYSGLPVLYLNYLPGLSIEVATNVVTGNWTVAAKTK